MKKLFLLALIIPMVAISNSNAAISVKISDGISNTAVKQKMEKQMSQLLTEINAAQAAGRELNLGPLGVPMDVQISMSMLWENSPFKCTENDIVERGLTTGSGYQVRNIPLMMMPTESGFNESEYQEAVISFDKQGVLQSFYLSLANNLYMDVMKTNRDVTDVRRRQLILDYVERFRTSYNTKDIKFLEQVFSDDALIITGKVVKQSKDNIKLPDKVVYNKQTKDEYIKNLRRVFANNSYIKVTFDEIKVTGHPIDPNIYGVTLHQGYTSSRYHDDGFLFLLWDFKNEDAPQIHVRTWQPDTLNGERLKESDIFSVEDFEFDID